MIHWDCTNSFKELLQNVEKYVQNNSFSIVKQPNLKLTRSFGSMQSLGLLLVPLLLFT